MPSKKPKIVIPKDQYSTQAEYKRLWCREKRRLFGRDKDRIVGYEEYVRQYNKKYRTTKEGYKEKKNSSRNYWRLVLRTKIIEIYSKGTNSCIICGFSDIRALDLDHIDNSGGKHRKVLKGGTYSVYKQLELAGFPEGYQILCRNCNWIKELERRSNAQRQRNQDNATEPMEAAS